MEPLLRGPICVATGGLLLLFTVFDGVFNRLKNKTFERHALERSGGFCLVCQLRWNIAEVDCLRGCHVSIV